MIVAYNKIQTTKNEKNETVKLSFSGGFNGLNVDMQVSGEAEDIATFQETHNLKKFGTRLEFELSNKQKTLNDNFEED